MNEALAHALTAIIGYLGGYPVLLFLTIMGLAPMAAVVWIVWRLPKMVNKISSKQDSETRTLIQKQDDRMQAVFERQDRRHEEVVRMYESNVDLVKAYDSVTKNYQHITGDLQELVLITGQTMQKLVDTSEKNTEIMITMIRGNNFCPIVRQRIGPGIIEEGKNNG